MYEELLKAVDQELLSASAAVQPPGSPETLEKLEKMAQAVFSRGLPPEYAEFLKHMDGLNWNGLMIYASSMRVAADPENSFIQGFVEANLLWRDYDPNKAYLIFAESGLSKYVFNIATSEYQILDRSSMERVKSVGSFEELITNAVTDHL